RRSCHELATGHRDRPPRPRRELRTPSPGALELSVHERALAPRHDEARGLDHGVAVSLQAFRDAPGRRAGQPRGLAEPGVDASVAASARSLTATTSMSASRA